MSSNMEIPAVNDVFVSIDDMLPYVGEFKKYQWILAVVCCIMIMPVSYQILIMTFAADDPSWRCVANSTYCSYNITFHPNDDKRCAFPRSEWEFTEPKEYSIVTYFDVYCEDSWLVECATSMLFIGWGVGGMVLGWAADNYGRKVVIFWSNSMILMSGLVSFVSNIYLFICFRFVTGFFIPGVLIEINILLSEMVGNTYRPLAANLVWIFTPLYFCVLCLKAYFVRNWKLLFILCTGPYMFVLFLCPYLPESPRWLRLHGKIDDLMKLLEKIAGINQREIPSHVKIEPHVNELTQSKSTPLALFRTQKIMKISLITAYATLSQGMIYFAFVYAISNLGDSLYLTFFLLISSEIPANILSVVFALQYGRKYPTLVAVVISGIACVVLAFISTMKTPMKVVMGIVGKFFLAISFGTLNIWCLELFPTTIRSQGIALLNVTFNIGSSLAPWIVFRLSRTHPSIPYVCMGSAAFSCFALTLFLHDTATLPTLETEEDLYINSDEIESYPLLNEDD